jgi:fructose-1-phosphate kinase PfkB-like protein
MRATFADGPALVVTDGIAGLWLRVDEETLHLPVPIEVRGASSVGAGDVLAAFMLMAMASRGVTAPAAASRAMDVVSQVLLERGGR